jgi:transposase
MAFVQLGVVGEAGGERRPLLAPPELERSSPPQASEAGSGTIEIALPNGVRICVDGLVNEKALSRVLRAMRSAL